MLKTRYAQMDSNEVHSTEDHNEHQDTTEVVHDIFPVSAVPDSVETPEPLVPTQVTPPAFVAVAPAEPAGIAVKQSDPITLVLQWLTYAFWGWFALATLWLAFTSFSFFTDPLSQSDWSNVVAYPIAAAIVLFLMAAVTDLFYKRREPAHKTGVATAIMVVHTVIFTLFGVGLIVSVVFIILQMILNASPDQMLFAMLYTALLGVLVYAILVARTTMVAKLKRIPVIAMGTLGAIALIFVILCIVGPMMQSLATKQDRQVESALSEVQSAVVGYTTTNKKLPTSLDGLKLADQYDSIKDTDVKALVHKGLIEYTPNVKSVTQDNYGISQDNSMNSSTIMYYYQLCATYTHDKNGDSSSRYPTQEDSPYSGASNSSSLDYINTYSHKAGRQCYALRVASNDYSSNPPRPL